ncbi:hypothetical protein ACUY3K_11085 [Corynebacterium uberis]|uniref:hypothetical protein n=1 Tax=Corynebacterium TaxID=1716 RepID=UPI001D0AF275|nr:MULTISPECIES: hypothetical protein [Corynebacterium]MCZ9309740.1 hypothetical protein [Corynebacterium sp. c6VSa_13]UDL73544.1 hypothetical protein LH391_10775 [Corynebacterium uberis]UDL75576.1 hypothetical protein LH393_10150 [Corynebacterium uberis]UDL77789.1 hypothetical protein LH394_10135 [Corynebacterium uberis]UDL80072.1 hypothetical protein LH392_10555 [Corynebacterium uberis]
MKSAENILFPAVGVVLSLWCLARGDSVWDTVIFTLFTAFFTWILVVRLDRRHKE